MSPGIRDDIIIKRKILKGMLQAAEFISEEVEQLEMLGECQELDATLQASFVQFRNTLQTCIDEMEAMVTAKTLGNGPSRSARKTNGPKLSRKTIKRRK